MSECNHNWGGRMVDPGYPDCLICKVDNLQAKLGAVKEILRPYTDEEGSTLIADIRAAIGEQE